MKRRITDIIPMTDIATWTSDHPVIIEAGTDTGKSYFIKSVLYQYAKERGEKILMLIHRKNCVNQFQMEIEEAGKADVITIMTYQRIETNKNLVDLGAFSYIVSDEFHYFTSDSRFNIYTDISFDTIMSCKSAVRIFMSATGEDVEQYIRRKQEAEVVKYELPPDWSFIKELSFFCNDDSIEIIATDVISKNEKAMIFIENTSVAYALYQKFADYAIFNCSESNPFYRHVDNEAIRQVLKSEKFEVNLLITTSCMDAGINIIDEKLKTIVVAGMRDVGSLIQCIGRKRRRNENDKISLYIKTINNNQLGGHIKRAKDELEMVEYLKENGSAMYLQKYARKMDSSSIVYDEPVFDGSGTATKKANELMYQKRHFDIAVYQEMIGLGNDGYCKYLARKFGFYDADTDTSNYFIYNEDHTLIAYLESMVGKPMLQVKDRKGLIEAIGIKSNGKFLKDIETLNCALRERRIPYHIVQKKDTLVVNGETKKYSAIWYVKSHTWNKH